MFPLLLAASLLLAALSAAPTVLAGPACARKHFQSKDCVQLCKSRWGWSGSMMGLDPWGSVMNKAKVSADTWNDIIVEACGLAAIPAPTPTASGAAGSPTLVTQPGPAIGAASDPAEIPPYLPTALLPSVVISILIPSVSIPPPVRTTSYVMTTSITSPVVLPTATHYAPPPPPPPPKPAPTTTRAQTIQAPPAATPKTNPGPGTGSSGSSSSDINTYLSAHNSVRAQHGASALTWSDNLAQKAQQWANGCDFNHSGGSLGPFGENLAAGTGDSYDIDEAVKSWTDEVDEYNQYNPQPSHFTQVVWKGSQQVGCAVQECDGIFPNQRGKAKYYVCEYSPAGNVIGHFAQNVQA